VGTQHGSVLVFDARRPGSALSSRSMGPQASVLQLHWQQNSYSSYMRHKQAQQAAAGTGGSARPSYTGWAAGERCRCPGVGGHYRCAAGKLASATEWRAAGSKPS
jgi:hypothetical protein